MSITKNLDCLEEGKSYIISFDVNEPYYTQKHNLTELKVLIKLKQSIKILMNGEIKWMLNSKSIIIYDEIPLKYYRKEKLEKIKDS